MPAQWTAQILGEMHLHGVTAKKLAQKLGLHEKYVSAIMNGHKEPAGAEIKFRTALEEIIREKES